MSDTEIDYAARVQAAFSEAGYPDVQTFCGISRVSGHQVPYVRSPWPPLPVVWRAFWAVQCPGLLCWPCWEAWILEYDQDPHFDCPHDPYAPDAELPPVVR